MGLSICWECANSSSYDCDRCINDDLFKPIENKYSHLDKSIILTDKVKKSNKYFSDSESHKKINGKYELIIMADRDGCDVLLMKFGIPILNYIKGNPSEYLKKITSFIIQNIDELENVYVDYSGYGITIHHELENIFRVFGIDNKLNTISTYTKLFE